MDVRRCPCASSSALRPPESKGVRGVQHEEDVETNVRARPRGGFTAMARSDAAHGDAVAPLLAQPGGQVDPRNAECTDFATSRSGSPVMTSLKAFPRLSRLGGEPCSRESWRTNTGRAASRHAAISSAMLRSHSGLLRGSPARSVVEILLHVDDDERDVVQVGHSDAGWVVAGRVRGRRAGRSRTGRRGRRPGRRRTAARRGARRARRGSFPKHRRRRLRPRTAARLLARAVAADIGDLVLDRARPAQRLPRLETWDRPTRIRAARSRRVHQVAKQLREAQVV